ncbi:MAG: hypothetical protein JRH18_02115 [Deltaproteobacteria bacterium]|nr:hypothetical protein [Deltaproteobacteria bacterium]MBW1962529.1 hypothetical protein [Deltaproteobacteria bacterium]MBW1992972.1 hypothetical protein [Deltaproteobacteria bacterium]MBW2150442.1 hypothetical protein [Deltaproteobacteria bacterium]
MGFIRFQEERLAMRYLVWQYQKLNLPVPPPSELQKQAAKIVNDAHRIAKKRGKNIFSIMKELVEELKAEKKKNGA